MKRLAALFSTGWARLGFVVLVGWFAWRWSIINDEGYWSSEEYFKLLTQGLVVPLIAIAVAWWIRLGFIPPEKRKRRTEARKQAALEASKAERKEQERKTGQFAEKRAEFDALIKATGVRKTIADELEASTTCLMCGVMFSFVSGRIELIEKDGHKGFLCHDCAAKVNEGRLFFGLVPFEILPGTYTHSNDESTDRKS